MSLDSLNQKLAKLKPASEPAKGKSAADALGGKVGNLQAMLDAIKRAPRGKEAALLQSLFGLDPSKADELVRLLGRERDCSEKGVNGSAGDESRESGHENGTERVARAHGIRYAVANLIKKASVLADFVTEDDRAESMEAVRRAKRAVHRVWNVKLQRMEEYPDSRTQLAAVALERAYDEGLPVQRVLSGRVEMETAEEIMARLRESPAAMAALRAARDAGATLTIGGETVDIEAEVEGVKERR